MAAPRRSGAPVVLLIALLALAGCSAPPATAGQSPSADSGGSSQAVASASVAVPDGTDAARADLALLLDQLESIHPEPFHGVPRDAFVAELDALGAALPTLSPEAAMVGLMRLVALLSREGRDGHQIAVPLPEAAGTVLPLRIWEFDDGVYVTAARAPYENLVGARLTGIGDHPIGEVLDAVEPLVPRDGPATVRTFRSVFLLRADVLRGLNIIGAGSRVEVEVEVGDGTAQRVDIESIPFADYAAWAGPFGMIRLPARGDVAYLRDTGTFAVDELPDDATLYVRLREVRAPTAAELAGVRQRAGATNIERVVLDLRQNPGGDNHTYRGLLDILLRADVDIPGRVFVLTDRTTFSAANLATEIERTTQATFAGEAMGGGLNFWDDVRFVTLADWPIPMQVGISTRYWQMAQPDDPRLTIEPDLPVASSSAAYFAGRDPVLEQVLARTR